MSKTIDESLPEFDQIVKGNVNIKKLSKQRYRITFSKIGKFLVYQVWDKDDVNKMNAKRQVGYVSANRKS
jgi:tagatose-1,6-bisphosphate aldolase